MWPFRQKKAEDDVPEETRKKMADIQRQLVLQTAKLQEALRVRKEADT